MPGDSYRGPIGCKHQVMQSGSVWPGFPWKVATPALTSGHSTAVTLVSQLPRRFQCGFATWLGNICLNVRSSCIVITRPLRLRRKNHPTLLIIGGNLVPQDPEQTTIFITYTLDAALHLGRLVMARKQEEARQRGVPMDSTWDGRIVGVFDMSNFGWSNIHYASQKAILRLLQKHYVERLYKIFIFCAPSIFHGLYQVLSLLLEEKSREKIVFISKSDASSRMIEDFDVDALAPAFGGTFKPRRIDETWQYIEAHNPNLDVLV